MWRENGGRKESVSDTRFFPGVRALAALPSSCWSVPPSRAGPAALSTVLCRPHFHLLPPVKSEQRALQAQSEETTRGLGLRDKPFLSAPWDERRMLHAPQIPFKYKMFYMPPRELVDETARSTLLWKQLLFFWKQKVNSVGSGGVGVTQQSFWRRLLWAHITINNLYTWWSFNGGEIYEPTDKTNWDSTHNSLKPLSADFMRVLFVHPQACYLKRIVWFWKNCSEHEQFPLIMECLIFSHSIAFLLMHSLFSCFFSLYPSEGQRQGRLYRRWGGSW